MVDISDLTSFIKSSPEDAAKNVERASIYDVSPDTYSQYKEQLDPKVDQMQQPTDASENTRAYMERDPERAALAGPDVKKLSMLDSILTSVSETVSGKPSRQERLTDLTWKKIWDKDNFSEDDQIQVQNLSFEMQEAERHAQKPTEPEEIFSNFADMFEDAKWFGGLVTDSMVQSYRTMGKGASEALTTDTDPIAVGARNLPGPVGKLAAASYGANKAMFKQSVSDSYNTLSNMTDEKGNPLNIDETTKRNFSLGVGVVVQSLELIGGHALVAPFSKGLAMLYKPSITKTLAHTAPEVALKMGLHSLGHAVATEGTTELLQEVTSITSEQIAKSWDGSPAGLMNGVADAVDAVFSIEGLKRYGMSGIVGGVAGAAAAVPATVAGHKATVAAIDKAKTRLAESDNMVNQRLKLFNPDKPINLVEESAVSQSVKALKVKEAFENAAKASKGAQMYELSPSELADFQRLIFEKNGFTKIWIDPSTVDEKAKRKMGVPESVINAPVAVDTHKFLDAGIDDPEVFNHGKLAPGGPSPKQGAELLKQVDERDRKEKELFQKLGMTMPVPGQAPEPSNVVDIPKNEKGEPIPFDFEAVHNRVSELIDARKREEDFIEKQKTALEVNREYDEAEGVVRIFDKEERERREGLIVKVEEQIKAINVEIESIKVQVNAEFSKKPVGDMIPVDFGVSMEDAAFEAEGDFVKSPTYTNVLRQVIPVKEQQKFDKAYADFKRDYLEGIKEAAELELNKALDMQLEIAMETQRQIEMDKLLQSREFGIVEKFMREQVANSKGKKSLSIYAINPEMLTDEQMKKYGDDERLKKIGVFSNDSAIGPEKAAQWLGAADGDELLHILYNFPTMREVAEARTAANAAAIEQEVRDNVPISHAKILRALTDESTIARKFMEHLRFHEWPAGKGAFKRIALPLPRVQDIAHKAYIEIQATKIKDLNVQQYRVGKRKSFREAINAIVKSEPAKAFLAKEAEITNIEMEKATLAAIGRHNRNIKFLKKLQDKAVIKILKDSGPLYFKAYQEIIDVFNLDPRAKGTSELGAFIAWAKEEQKAGRGDFSIPDYVSDIRPTINDMTVEQVQVVTDRLRTLLHSAKEDMALYNSLKRANEKTQQEILADQMHQQLSSRHDYDPKKIPPVQNHNLPPSLYIRKLFSTAESMFTNMEFVLKQLDGEKYGGLFQRTFMHPLKGDAAWNEKSGYSLELKYTKALRKYFEKHIEAYGKEDFERLESVRLDIKEFKDSTALNNGKLTKADLITLWIYGGDPDGKRKRGENHGVTNEVIQKVLDRELEERDVVLGQKMIVDGYKRYREATQALQKETTGQDVKFIEGITNYHRGKAYAGGYVPNKHKIDFTAEAADRNIEFLKQAKSSFYEGKDPELFARKYAAEQTEQGRLEERVGSKLPLDLSLTRAMRGHEEVIHDLSYRKVIIDSLKLLRDEKIRHDIISTVGAEKYGILVNTVIEMANRIEYENNNYFSDQNRLMKTVLGRLQSNLSVTLLGLNPTSVAIQTVSIGQAIQNMGINGAKHMAVVNSRLAQNPDLIKGFYNLANELDPTIGHFMEQITNKVVSNVMDLAPGGKFQGKLGMAQTMHEHAINGSMAFMAGADMIIKTKVALAAYEQFMAGDVEGYSLEKVQGMSEKEQHEAAQAYVRQISRTSLTHSRDEDKAAFQKNPLGAIATNFWNDARNVMNNQMTQYRKGKTHSIEAWQNYKKGDKKAAVRSLGGVAGVMGMTILVSAMTRVTEDLLRKKPIPKITDPGQAFTYMLTAPMQQFFTVSPLVRDIQYGVTAPRRSTSKHVEFPINKVGNDIATTVNALGEVLFMERAIRHLDKQQVIAMMNTFSYLIFPIPVNGPNKLAKMLKGKPAVRQGELDRLRADIKKFKEDPAAKEVSDKFMKELNLFEAKITPQDHQ